MSTRAALYSAAVADRYSRGSRSDRELLAACRRGDPAAWEALVRKYRHLVYSIALRSHVAPEAAADVFQAVFLSLIRSLDRLRQEETLVPWLVTAARRESWKAARSSRLPYSDDSPVDALPVAATAQDELEELELQVLVRAALDRIDARCRQLIEALFYSDPPPTYAEISRAMHMPVPSLGPTRIRCLEKLRRELARDARFSSLVSGRPLQRSIRTGKGKAQ